MYYLFIQSLDGEYYYYKEYKSIEEAKKAASFSDEPNYFIVEGNICARKV